MDRKYSLFMVGWGPVPILWQQSILRPVLPITEYARALFRMPGAVYSIADRACPRMRVRKTGTQT